jgi:hypothetical protein
MTIQGFYEVEVRKIKISVAPECKKYSAPAVGSGTSADVMARQPF